MKKINIILSIICCLFVFSACSKDEFVVTDLEIYKNREFDNPEIERLYTISEQLDEFLPLYEDLNFEYSQLKFYILNPKFKLGVFYSGTSATLDIYLTEDNFEEVKNLFYEQYKFFDDKNLYATTYKDFYCEIVDGIGNPDTYDFGMLCVNEKSKVIRFHYHFDDSIRKDNYTLKNFFDVILSNSEVEWENLV